jgi:hypothetical protein
MTPILDSWTKKADFPGRDRFNGVAFSVDGKGYYGAGEAKEGIVGLRDCGSTIQKQTRGRSLLTFLVAAV